MPPTRTFQKWTAWDGIAGLLPIISVIAIVATNTVQNVRTGMIVGALALVSAMLMAVRSVTARELVSGWRRGAANAMLLIAIGITALAIATREGPIALLSASAFFFAWSLGRCGHAKWQSIAGWSLLVATAGIEPLVTIVVRSLLPAVATIASYSLDSLKIPYFYDGKAFQLNGLSVPLATDSESILCVQSLCMLAVLIAVARHRSLLAGLLNIALVAAWSLIAISLWTVLTVMGHHAWQRDLTCGWDHVLLVTTCWLFAAICMTALEEVLASIIAPIPPSNSESDFLFRSVNVFLLWPQPDPALQLELDEPAATQLSNKSSSPSAKSSVKEEEEADDSLLHSWLHAVTRPGLLLQSFVDLLIGWLFTRKLLRISLCLLIVLPVGWLISFPVRGSQLTKKELLNRYSQEVQSSVAQADDLQVPSSDSPQNAASVTENSAATPSNSAEANRAAWMGALQQRLLSLGDTNPETQFRLAMSYVARGDVSSAETLMQQLAPDTKEGFAPAHAWLASHLLANAPTRLANNEGRRQLAHHLRVAYEQQRATPLLCGAYAQVLEQSGKGSQAIEVMATAAKADSKLRIALAAMASRQKNQAALQEVSREINEEVATKLEDDSALAKDWLELGTVKLFEGKFLESHDTAQQGLRKFAGDPALRRLASEALRQEFRQRFQKNGSNQQFNLDLLDAALKADPTNPAIAEELAMITAAGINASDSLKQELEVRLADGRATALTHLILANKHLSVNALPQAIPHLETALKQAPNSPVILNNLALTLALTDKTQIDRAIDLIAQAIRFGGPYAEFFDTQGEILILANKPVEAIACLENAIALDRSRIGTRRLLIKAYRMAGMSDMVAVQERIIATAESNKNSTASPNGK